MYVHNTYIHIYIYTYIYMYTSRYIYIYVLCHVIYMYIVLSCTDCFRGKPGVAKRRWKIDFCCSLGDFYNRLMISMVK